MDRRQIISYRHIKKTLKALPTEGPFYMEHFPDDDTVYNFGEFLLKKVHSEEKNLKNDYSSS